LQGISSLFATVIVVALIGITLRANSGNDWTEPSLEVTWRVAIVLPAISSLFVFIYRWKMWDPRQFSNNNYKNFQKHPYRLALRRFGWRFVSTCAFWFLFDVVFYTNSLFSSLIIGSVVPDATILKKAKLQLALVSIGLSGHYISLFAVDSCTSIVIGGVLPYLNSVPVAFIIT